MTEPTPQQEEDALRTVRVERADLFEELVRLEHALAAPLPGRIPAWSAAVHEALVDLAAAFERHIAVNEGPSGLFSGIRDAAPRLDGELGKLTAEHAEIRSQLASALSTIRDVESTNDPDAALTAREEVSELLARLTRHRQRGADLVWEAYSVDIGVGD